MKILFITERQLEDGGAQIIPRTPLGYVEFGHDVYYISCNSNNDKYKSYIWKGVNVIEIRNPVNLNHKNKRNLFVKFIYNLLFSIKFNKLVLSEAEKIISIENPDLIYGYEVFGVNAMKKLKKRYSKLKYVSRFQGTIYYKYLNSKFSKVFLFHHYKALTNVGDLCIMTNDGTFGDKVIKYLNPKFRNLLFLPNGVREFDYCSEKKIMDLKKEHNIDNHITFLTVSRLVGWKRIDRSINAFAKLPLEIRKHVKLLIIGDGPAKNQLKKLVDENKLVDCVCFVGKLDNEQVGYYFQMSDVFLSFYDLSNYGNPILEALKSGKAIITLNNGATNTLIKNHENGILLENTDNLEENISIQIEKFVTNPALIDEYSKKALEYANKYILSWRNRMEAEITAVNELLKK